MIEKFNGDLPGFLEGEKVPVDPFWAPDAVLINFEPSPFPGTYHGHEGVRKWTQDIFGEYSEGRVDVIEVEERGDLMAVHLKLTARGRVSGIEGSFEWGSLLTMRDGRCVHAASDAGYERTLERLQEAGDAPH